MDEINWTNKIFPQNSSFYHINTVTIWIPVLDQRKGGSRREFTVTWWHRNFNADVTLQVAWLFKARGPGPGGSRAATDSCPPLCRHSISLSSRIILLCPRAAPVSGIHTYPISLSIPTLHTYPNYPTYVSQLSYIPCHLSHLSATCLCSG
jgi:hypothetical protein